MNINVYNMHDQKVLPVQSRQSAELSDEVNLGQVINLVPKEIGILFSIF
jgi:hypothetical protein